MKLKSDRKPNSRLLLSLAALVAIVLIMIVLTWKFELYKVVAGLFSVLFLGGGADANAINAAKNVCLEPGCVLAAADIINAMDEKVDPCTGKCLVTNRLTAILTAVVRSKVQSKVQSKVRPSPNWVIQKEVSLIDNYRSFHCRFL